MKSHPFVQPRQNNHSNTLPGKLYHWEVSAKDVSVTRGARSCPLLQQHHRQLLLLSSKGCSLLKACTAGDDQGTTFSSLAWCFSFSLMKVLVRPEPTELQTAWPSGILHLVKSEQLNLWWHRHRIYSYNIVNPKCLDNPWKQYSQTFQCNVIL